MASVVRTPNEEYVTEEQALLTGAPHSSPPARTQEEKRKKWQQLGLFTWAVIATAAVIVLGVLYQKKVVDGRDGRGPGKITGKRNLVFMVSDGKMDWIQ